MPPKRVTLGPEPPKPKERRVLAETNKRLTSFNDVAALKAVELKQLCRSHGINETYPKKAKQIFVCHVLGLSTTGHAITESKVSEHLSNAQAEELEQLTIKRLCQIVNWTKDLTSVPDVEESSVKKYLLQTNCLTKESARTYKITRPYQLKSGVHSMRYYENMDSETFCIITSRVNPSQSTSPEEVKVVFAIIDKITGMPYGGFCTCTVGYSERCGHIGATLFRLSDLVASGVKEIPDDDSSVTSQLCKWTDPKGAASDPSIMDELTISSKTKPVRRTLGDFGKKVANPNPPTYDAVLQLKSALASATQHLGQYCPAVHVLNCSRFSVSPSMEPSVVCESLPDHLDIDSPLIAYNKEVSVESLPMSIVNIPCENVDTDTFIKKISYSEEDIQKIESVTRGQCNNEHWFEQRQGAITASKFGKVLNVIEKNKSTCDSLLKEILRDTSYRKGAKVTVPALKWGLTQEKKAKSLYLGKFQRFHSDLTLKEVGLVVYQPYQFIRASPDGIVSCKCHESRLLEVKCPYSARYMTIAEGVFNKKIKYLESVNGRYVLKTNSPEGYYEQVQGQMAVLGLKSSNLFVWTVKDSVTVHVPFNQQFWEDRLLPACLKFFRVHVVPRLLARAGPVCIVSPAHDDDDVSVTVSQLGSEMAEETVEFRCGQCQKLLPDNEILADNSNASVGCDCPNCEGSCSVWFCWPCAKYDEEYQESGTDWYCPTCTRDCDIVY